MSKIERARASAKQWLKAIHAGDAAAIARLRHVLPKQAPEAATLRTVQHALARELGWPGWSAYKAYLTPPSDTAPELQALLAAAEGGDPASVEAALNAHPELLNQRGEAHPGNGLRTALHYGVHHAAVVRELLRRGADPNLRDQGDNAMPLHFAAERGNLEAVRLLVEHGADTVGAGTMHELDVLGWATVFGNGAPKLVAYLLAHGARHTLATAVAVGDVTALRELVRRSSENLNMRLDHSNRKSSLLHLAVNRRQPAAVEALLEMSPELEATDSTGLTPLDRAALNGEREMAAMLESAGAQVGLPAAVGLGRADRAEALLREDPEAVRAGGRWARLLHRAAEHGTAAMIELLVRAGASLELGDDPEVSIDGTHGLTPLHAAACNRNTEAARALIRLGAPVSPRDSRYCGTPAGWADYAKNIETRDTILEGPCDIWDAIAYGRQQRLAEILARDPEARYRSFGAYASCSAEPDERPLERAQKSGWAEIARMLEGG